MVQREGGLDQRHNVLLRLECSHAAAERERQQREVADVRAHVDDERRYAALSCNHSQ